jgi:hypothetical protein
MIGRADVDVRQCVGAIQKLRRCAEIWHWFPDEERFGTSWVEGFPTAENGGYEVDAAGC